MTRGLSDINFYLNKCNLQLWDCVIGLVVKINDIIIKHVKITRSEEHNYFLMTEFRFNYHFMDLVSFSCKFETRDLTRDMVSNENKDINYWTLKFNPNICLSTDKMSQYYTDSTCQLIYLSTGSINCVVLEHLEGIKIARWARGRELTAMSYQSSAAGLWHAKRRPVVNPYQDEEFASKADPENELCENFLLKKKGN